MRRCVFHIDTRSAANEDRGREFGMQNRVRAAGRFGMGPWGASAEVENNISYVSTQRSQRTEEINTDLELNSSVELNFRTDYLPLNEMAADSQADRIRQASLNPSAANDSGAEARATRQREQRAAEASRAGRLQFNRPDMATTPLTPPEPNSDGSSNQNNQAGNNQTGNNQTGNNQTGNNQTGNNQTGNNQTGNNQTGNNQTGNNQTGNNQTGNNQTGNNPSNNGQSGSN